MRVSALTAISLMLIGCATPNASNPHADREPTMTTDTRPIIVEETYSVEAAVVWNAITDPAQMSRWYFEPIREFKAEVGFETQFNVHALGKDYLHLWKVIEVVPGERISYTFNFGGIDGNALVLWELSKVDGGTKLTLTHSGLETFPPGNEPALERDSGVAGWKYFLNESLKNFLEPNM